MPKKYKSKIAAAVHEAMHDAHDVGLLDKQIMREFDKSCLTMVGRLSLKLLALVKAKGLDAIA